MTTTEPLLFCALKNWKLLTKLFAFRAYSRQKGVI